MKQAGYLPAAWSHSPRIARGDGRGLGKRIVKDGKWVGQRHAVWEGAKVTWKERWG